MENEYTMGEYEKDYGDPPDPNEDCDELVQMKMYGKVFGVTLEYRGKDDPVVMFRLLTEDDGNWFPFTEGSGTVNAAFLDDLISILNVAKATIVSRARRRSFGEWEFRDKPKVDKRRGKRKKP